MRNTYIYPPRPSSECEPPARRASARWLRMQPPPHAAHACLPAVRIISDIMGFLATEMPKFNSISISGV